MIKTKIFFLIITLFVSNTFAKDYIIVQSTTSTANTGLLDLLSEEFSLDTGIEVRAVAVGTGTAIANARKGDGDVLIVHSKVCLLYTSPSPRDAHESRMPSSA